MQANFARQIQIKFQTVLTLAGDRRLWNQLEDKVIEARKPSAEFAEKILK
jgi:hypothetical protein